jgi:hypothetical protein
MRRQNRPIFPSNVLIDLNAPLGGETLTTKVCQGMIGLLSHGEPNPTPICVRTSETFEIAHHGQVSVSLMPAKLFVAHIGRLLAESEGHDSFKRRTRQRRNITSIKKTPCSLVFAILSPSTWIWSWFAIDRNTGKAKDVPLQSPRSPWTP